MSLNPDHQTEIFARVSDEVDRLQKLSTGGDVLMSSGRTIEDLTGIISGVVLQCLIAGGTIEYEYTVPWMTQVLLKKGSTQKDLRIDNSKQILYDAKPDIVLSITNNHFTNIIFSSIPDRLIFDWYVQNLDQVISVLQGLREMVSQKKDILILSNHATWFNLPLIAHCLHRIFKIPQENIYTILGPAITHSHWSMAGILRYSNALKTYPDTERAVTSYPKIDTVRRRFSIKIHKIFNSENGTGSSRVALIAPSGTTDKMGKDGSLSMSQPSDGTKRLVAGLIEDRGLSGFVIGVNDTEIIPSGHSRPKKGRAFVGMQRVDSDNWQQTLPDCILDQYGNPIGKWSEK